jgi:hypothetical protein
LNLDLAAARPGGDAAGDRPGDEPGEGSDGDRAVAQGQATSRASWAAAADAVSEVRQRYGDTAVGPATLLGRHGLVVRRHGDAPWGPSDG